jgi:cystathionine gamma-synthase
MNLTTRALHADDELEPDPDVAPPIHVATTYAADNPAGLVYSRDESATRRRLEAVLGDLEGGHAVCYASGQAALHAALVHFRPRRVALAPGGYHGSRALLELLAGAGTLAVADLEAEDPEAGLAPELGPGDLVWLETPQNPTTAVRDIAAHAARAHAAGARLVVDSTFATPVLQNPLALGADAVMHSSTKFLSGHSDALGGVLVVADPERAAALRAERTLTGAVPGALETWLTLRGVRTLVLRVTRQTENATGLASWLAGRVARVWHPSRPDHPGYAIAQRQMRGPGPVLAIELADPAAAQALPGRLRLFRDATSLGGVESLAEWRRRHDPHAPETLVRISVGLEDVDDLIADLEQAL